MRNISACQKKAQEYKNEQIFFVIFDFVSYVYQLKIVSFQNLSQRTISKILSFEGISVVISQKLNELDQFKIGRFFWRRTVYGLKDTRKFSLFNALLYDLYFLNF